MSASITIASALKALHQHAMSFPGVRLDHPWGHDAFKVKEKVFLFLGGTAGPKGGLSFSMKLPVSGQLALELPFCEPTGYGMGKHGWVSGEFKKGEVVPLGLLLDWVTESFRAIAPAKVLKELDATGAATRPTGATPRSATARRAPAKKRGQVSGAKKTAPAKRQSVR
jgi:predicted DNA-binding protein (MmcQ/YjbR family)